MSTRDVSELTLLGFFLTVSVGFAALTTTFRSSSAQLFPRLTAGVIIVGVVLLFVEERLPEPLQRIVAEPVDLVDREEFAEYQNEAADGVEGVPTAVDADEAADGSSEFSATDGTRLTSRQFTFAAIAGYVGLAYVASILVVTPLFVLLYGYWNRQPKWIVLLLAALSIGICLAFMSLANAPLDRSLLFPRGIL